MAAWSEFRSTLETSDSLERRASARLRAHSMWREQRALAKIFPVCRSFSFFFQKRTRLKDYKKNVRKQINGKFYSLKFKIYPHLFATEPFDGAHIIDEK